MPHVDQSLQISSSSTQSGMWSLPIEPESSRMNIKFGLTTEVDELASGADAISVDAAYAPAGSSAEDAISVQAIRRVVDVLGFIADSVSKILIRQYTKACT